MTKPATAETASVTVPMTHEMRAALAAAAAKAERSIAAEVRLALAAWLANKQETNS